MVPQEIPIALTFDDVLLLPQKSEVLPHEVDTSTLLARDIRLKIPMVSAAMDSVTESKTAIAMARMGGVGVIHRNMDLNLQALEVAKVKRAESGMILNPITLNPQQKLKEAVVVMQENNISGVPITEGGRLVGILTSRDLRFETNLGLKIADAMTTKVITTGETTTLEQAREILQKNRIEKLPVVDDRGNLKGLFTIKDVKRATEFPNACKDSLGRLRVGAAIGVGESALVRAGRLIESGVDLVAIDTAHGHSAGVLETAREFKKNFNVPLIVGNVATGEAVQELVKIGVDAVKVGVGPGSICTTRMVSGVGVPQFSAVLECSRVARDRGIPVIADGGIKYSGDITKALAAGADAVMIGGLFAGTDEAPGETILYQGRTYKAYRGMGSLGAMVKGSGDRYAQGGVEDRSKLVPEGVEGMVPHRGSLSSHLYQLVGGLRAGMGYLGAKNLQELRAKARFVRITASGLKESHVHDVMITKEAPNYKPE
ncbi:MAG: IMP dehydrogenase [Deltaproteobacteria bacterium]|nr:IMP dehydrogenase [Deltaproteobacteria bacterium]